MANRAQAENNYRAPPEMTADDLGLSMLVGLDAWHLSKLLRLDDLNYCAKHDNLYATVCRACEP